MIVRCAGLDGQIAFENPCELLEAAEPSGVAEVFARAQAALDRGRYVAGFVSYEAGAAFVPRQAPAGRTQLPAIRLGVYERPAANVARTRETAAQSPPRTGPLVPRVSRSRYLADLATIAAAIREGDVYQANYAVPFDFSFADDPASLFAALARAGAYPYAAYVDDGTLALVSCSPEVFVRREGERLTTKPMKGTALRERAAELGNEKNRAEHVMIVDLLRNDLHRLSNRTRVATLAEVEAYPQFVTMTSTIEAELPRGTRLGEIFAAMFPCGSITGAPKTTAMQTIARTERAARGIFCGSIGYAEPNGSGLWNVAIRTAALDRRARRGTLWIGGGIVADSQPDAEWTEILTKRAFFERVAPRYALLETLRRDEAGRYPDLEAHLARLRRSADDLHVAYDDTRIRAALARAGPPGAGLVRLQLEADGSLEIAVRDLETPLEPVRVCWARTMLESAEPALRYKTTWRPAYDAAAAEAREADCFEALLCSERGEVADGSRTTLFVRLDGQREGQLLTPPLSSGALPGILRARLLREGRARCARLRREDVERANAIYVGNAARGLLRATLVQAAVPA